MADLRIFSYLPNPRIWKATIAARLCGVEVEVRGAAPPELATWRWDFDARPLSEEERKASTDVRVGKVGFSGTPLHKTDAFLAAHPFGTVPAAFSPDGKIGIFESNSIMRAVARLGESKFPLYGKNAYEASRVDSFLDVSLVFARDSQVYLLSLMGGTTTDEIRKRANDAFHVWAGGIEQTLTPDREFLVGDGVTLADICFVCELVLFSNEKRAAAPILSAEVEAEYPRAFAHFGRLSRHRAFAPDVEPYLAKLTLR